MFYTTRAQKTGLAKFLAKRIMEELQRSTGHSVGYQKKKKKKLFKSTLPKQPHNLFVLFQENDLRGRSLERGSFSLPQSILRKKTQIMSLYKANGWAEVYKA